MTKSVLSVAAVLAACGAAHAGQVQSLATLSGAGDSFAYGINDAGQIVGTSATGGGTSHATLWTMGGGPVDLGFADGSTSSVAYKINASGDAVGYSEADSGLRTSTLWSGGRVRDLGAEMGAVGSNVAWDINDGGTVVGQAPLNPGFAKGYVWDDTDGGRLAGGSRFYMGGANYGVNNAGVLVGSGFFFGDPDDAFKSVPDGRGGYFDSDINPAGFHFSQARDVNNLDVAVGHTSATTDNGWDAVIFDGRGDVTVLGRLAGYENHEAFAINDRGMVVGYAWDSDFELANSAWAWVDGTMYDLNDYIDGSGFVHLFRATDINENGDIVGFGQLADGSIAGFVITGFVPAPGTVGAMALGLGLAGRRRR